MRNKSLKADGDFGLPEIGAAIEKLMGNAYKCHYTSRQFKNKYEKYRKKAMVYNLIEWDFYNLFSFFFLNKSLSLLRLDTEVEK